MKPRYLLVGLGFLFFLIQSVEAKYQLPAVSQNSLPRGGFADVVTPLMPAIVNISTITHVKKQQGYLDLPQFPPGSPFEELFQEFFRNLNPRERVDPKIASGSGFIIDPAGYIVTNNHVIADADQITIILNDNTKLKATLVGKDSRTDLALLKVDVKHPLPYVTWGDARKVRVGDWVIAIGNPFGLGGTVTSGIISHIGRDIGEKQGMNHIEGYFQTDAAINVGNSGGPLFTAEGKVIGINTAIYSPTGGSVGIGFAIPSSVAQPVIEQLKKFGRIKRGWIGVNIQNIDQGMAKSVNLSKAQGVIVADLIPDGPAKKAGMMRGDIILNFKGIPLGEARYFPQMVTEIPIGSVVPIVIWRKNLKTARYEEVTLNVTIEEFKEDKNLAGHTVPLKKKSQDQSNQSILGLTLKTLTPELGEKFNFGSNIQGALVLHVDKEPGGSDEDEDEDTEDLVEAHNRIRRGDLIVEIGQEPVITAEGVIEKIKKAQLEGQTNILLLICRKSEEGIFTNFYVSLNLSKTEKISSHK